MYSSGSGQTKPFILGKSYGLLSEIYIKWLIGDADGHDDGDDDDDDDDKDDEADARGGSASCH